MHVLLGRLWLFDLDINNFKKLNTYTFAFNGKRIVFDHFLTKGQYANQKNVLISYKQGKTSLLFMHTSHIMNLTKRVESKSSIPIELLTILIGDWTTHL